ncbi:cyclopropane fatty acyl phospholipid synthase [Salmonella enterica]|nr:cyclopropane fatty acyl phospholipid synthase [Salmonella enterica]
MQDNRYFNTCSNLLSDTDIEFNGDHDFDIQVKNNDLFKRLLAQGSLGFGESYMDGWWECDKIDELVEKILLADIDSILPKNFNDFLQIIKSRMMNLQSKKRAWIVGKEHYDLGNDLFQLMLEPYMQYSCGYWAHAHDLQSAQQEKLKLICEKLQLERGMKLLDIGCGWGGLAQYAAEHYGVSVTGITISAEQQKLAQARCAAYDVEILLQDYRDLNRKFDRIVSVGMFEHVGPKNYHVYFDMVNRNLVDDGIFLLHTIGANKTDLKVDAWINKYIFPNGCLPSIVQIASASELHFIIEDLHNFGPDYDRTLMAWLERFKDSWHLLEKNYSDRFYRMFTYYLTVCAGAFRARNIQLWQIVFTRGNRGGLRVPR